MTAEAASAVKRSGSLPAREALQWLAFLAAATAVSALFILRDRTVPDPDSFYHFRHAALYAERGLLIKDFPWLVYSIINRFSSDIGYGFHVLLIPFALLRDPILGIKLAALAETVVVMALVYFALRRHAVSHAFGWPFMLLLLGPPMTFTLMQTRPQTLTMGFAALLFSSMLVGSAWAVAASSFLIAFVHLNIFLIAPAIALLAFIARGACERAWEWPKLFAMVAGLAVGWLLRPNPLGAAKLEYVQVILHAVVRQHKLPLLFGREWLPVPVGQMLALFGSFMLLWALFAVLFLAAWVRGRPSLSPADRAFLWGSLGLSVACFAVTVLNTKRATPFWAVFAVLFAAKALSCLLAPARKEMAGWLKQEARLILALLVAAVFGLMAWDVVSEHLVQRKWPGMDPYRMKAASEWLREHSQPGDVVFNVDWGMFPELFFWNTQDRYVWGLDPIFLYAYDQSLYWRAHHLATGEATDATWGAQNRSGARPADTYKVLKDDFRASYIVLDPSRNPELSSYLQSDAKYALGFQDSQAVVYRLR